MSSYGVQTNNPFDLLIAADETLRAAAKAKAEKAKAKPKPKKATQPGASQKTTQAPKKKTVHLTTEVPPICPPTQRMPKTAAPLGDQVEKKAEPEKQEAPAAEGGKKAGKPQKKGGENAQTPKQDGSASNAAPVKETGTGGKPRGGQRGGARPQTEAKANDSLAASGPSEGLPARKQTGPREKGDRKPPGGFTRNREFDRRSGTGRPANENKKGGAGAGNWGKAGVDELKAEADVKEELKTEVPAAEGEAKVEAEKKKNKKKNKKKAKGEDEEEDKEKKDEIPDEQLKLFDDFMKTQKKPKVALPAPRKPDEGNDPSWAAATKVERKTEEVFFLAPPKDEKKKVKEAPKTEQKLTKSKLKRMREKKKREEERKKLEKDTISSIFDFTAKKEAEAGFGGPRRNGPRGGKGRDNGGRRRFDDDAPRAPREDRPQGGLGRGGAPRKFGVSVDAPQFDDSSFPALQVGPPSATSE